jgi:hypothetical protein
VKFFKGLLELVRHLSLVRSSGQENRLSANDVRHICDDGFHFSCCQLEFNVSDSFDTCVHEVVRGGNVFFMVRGSMLSDEQAQGLRRAFEFTIRGKIHGTKLFFNFELKDGSGTS